MKTLFISFLLALLVQVGMGQFNFTEEDRATARREQAISGVYSKEDIMGLDITEKERKELLMLQEKSESEKRKEQESRERKREKKEAEKKAFEEKISQMTPEEKANYIFAQLKKGYAAIIEVTIKENMHDPDSFEFVSFIGQPLKVESGRIDVKAIYKFRGKNPLGVKVLNSMECKINTDTGKIYDVQNPKMEEEPTASLKNQAKNKGY